MRVVVVAILCCLTVSLGLHGEHDPGAIRKQAASHSLADASPSAIADISKDVVDTTITRLQTASALGPWEYSRALFLLGELSVYQRTRDPRYLTYARAWADSHIDAHGSIDRPIDALDFIMPGNVAIILYQETDKKKYKLAADRLAKVFKKYPRTSDGGFWHAIDNGREHQLWLDGTYMALPFIVKQGVLSGNRNKTDEEAVRQLLVYGAHLRDAHGPLYFHAYDELGKAPWANPITHQSSVKWGRAIGWYGMALVDVLEAMPQSPATAEERAQRQQLIAIVQNMAHDLVGFQDPTTGLWFQIVDKPKLKGNFLETSSSSMFTYFLDSAVKHGYIDSSYRAAAQRGYRGVLSKVVLGTDGHFHIKDICEGTNVGDQAYYLGRKLYTDDFHGLGAFLLMNEEVQFNRSMMD
jgi:unsaturated rhamnogalacturonyl hydrolase